jgi:hypothetical protein
MDLAALLLAGDWSSSSFYKAVDVADAADVAAVLALAAHGDPVVRGAVARTLPLLTHGDVPTAEMVEAAVALSADPDKRVRDYSCFALAEQWREVDTPAVREALAARLDDIDREARSEALVGLAYRQDPRALPRVRAALSRPSGDVWRLEMVAAGALSDTQLHDLVLRHQAGWDDAGTADAVRRLTDPRGPGDDVLDGVAELYRRRAHGRPDGDALSAWQLLADMLDIAPHRAGEFFGEVLARLDGDDAALREVRTSSTLAQLVETGE